MTVLVIMLEREVNLSYMYIYMGYMYSTFEFIHNCTWFICVNRKDMEINNLNSKMEDEQSTIAQLQKKIKQLQVWSWYCRTMLSPYHHKSEYIHIHKGIMVLLNLNSQVIHWQQQCKHRFSSQSYNFSIFMYLIWFNWKVTLCTLIQNLFYIGVCHLWLIPHEMKFKIIF